MIPILVKGDDVRSGTKVNARHGQLPQASTGSVLPKDSFTILNLSKFLQEHSVSGDVSQPLWFV